MKQLPQSIEAEVALLGALLVYPEIGLSLPQYGLEPRDFYKREHQILFDNMNQLVVEHQTLDVNTIVPKLDSNKVLDTIGGLVYLSELTNGSGTPSSFNYYVDVVLEKSQKRNLIEATQIITENSFDSAADVEELLEKAERSIKQIALSRRTEAMQSAEEVVTEVHRQMKENKSGQRVTGLHTGFDDFDNLTSGLQRGDLIILAARPSVGKTAFALNLALNVSKMNKNAQATAAIFSLEMPATHLMMRMLAAQSGVEGNKLRTSNLTNDEWGSVNQAVVHLKDRNIFIDDSSTITMPEIYAKCRRLREEQGLDIVVIDYIQLISSKGSKESRQLEVSEISRSLKQLARDMDVPVVALSQLSRVVEARGGAPQLSDLRESGSLEQDADIVMFLARHLTKEEEDAAKKKDLEEGGSVHNNDRMIHLLVRKHRNGGLGNIALKFNGNINRFYSTVDDSGASEY
jgi:replicative DNA helicase